MEGGVFSGTTAKSREQADFIRTMFTVNCVPPPDMGLFQGDGVQDFERNAGLLAAAIRRKIAEIDEERRPQQAALHNTVTVNPAFVPSEQPDGHLSIAVDAEDDEAGQTLA